MLAEHLHLPNTEWYCYTNMFAPHLGEATGSSKILVPIYLGNHNLETVNNFQTCMFCIDRTQTPNHLLKQNVTELKIWHENMETNSQKDVGINGRVILQWTECSCLVISTSVSCLKGLWFRTRSWDQPSWLRSWVVFLGLSRQIPVYYLKTGHYRFHLRPFESTIRYHAIICRCIVWHIVIVIK